MCTDNDYDIIIIIIRQRILNQSSDVIFFPDFQSPCLCLISTLSASFMYRAKKVFLNTKKKNETKQNKTNSHHLVIGEKQKQNVCFISDLFIHEKQNQFVILYRHTHRERERD